MWLYIPSGFCRSVQESEDLISASDWRIRRVALSAMLKSKHSQPRYWLRVWQKERWTKLLSGIMLKPLEAKRGVDRRIALWADSHASRSPMLGENAESKTPDISGLTSPESSEKSSPNGVSLRTFQGSYQPELLTVDTPTRMPQTTYKKWVSELRQDYSRRKKLAHHTDDSDSLFWRSPSQQESGVKASRLDGELGHRMYDKETGRLAQVGLTQQAEIWMTRSSRDWKDTGVTDNVPTNSLLGRQVLRTPMDGEKSSPQTKQLNPRFAEWLMGWVKGWTHPLLPISETDFKRWVTESSHSLRRMLSVYFGTE